MYWPINLHLMGKGSTGNLTNMTFSSNYPDYSYLVSWEAVRGDNMSQWEFRVKGPIANFTDEGTDS